MARQYPHVKFYGLDIGACPYMPLHAPRNLSNAPAISIPPVPIATRYPPRNVLFEMHDIMDPFRYSTGSIDMVHARSITMAVCSQKRR